MKINFKGNTLPIKEEQIMPSTRNIFEASASKALLLDDSNIDEYNQYIPDEVQYIVTDLDIELEGKIVIKYPSIKEIDSGDILHISPKGQTRRIFRVNSNSNSLLVTERCNSNCVMCSQPPKDRNDIPGLLSLHDKLIPLIPKETQILGVTGGEPTLLGEHLFKMIKDINYFLPETEVHILTNGRRFAEYDFVEKLSSVTNKEKVMFAIPLYNDFYQIHDYVVQSKGAFYQTIQGLRYMGSFGFRIEIRIVLHSIVLPRLTDLLEYIYLNFPFVEHVALMGLEMTGFAIANKHKLWVDPQDYSETLIDAFKTIKRTKLNASIYNIPLCLLDESLWGYSRKSISDWKNDYLDECSKCSKLNDCGGIFTTSKFQSQNIKAF